MFFCVFFVFFFKQKTAYEMRISDWSSDVCSSDLARELVRFSAGITRNILYRNVAEPRRQDVGKHPGFVILHRVQGNGDSADAAVSLCRKFIRISGTLHAAWKVDLTGRNRTVTAADLCCREIRRAMGWDRGCQ